MIMKRAISSILTVAVLFYLVSPVAATASQSNHYKTMNSSESLQSSFTIVGGGEIMSWEDGYYLVVDQYDTDGNLFDRVVYDKNAGTATSSYNEKTTGSSEFIVENLEVQNDKQIQLLQTREGTYIDKVRAVNGLTLPPTEKTMMVFVEEGDTITTTCTIPSGAKTVAQLVVAFTTGLLVSASVANLLVAAAIGAGIGSLSGGVVEVLIPTKFACETTYISYYGKDQTTSEKSDSWQCAERHVITDEASAYLDEVYVEGFVYDGDQAQTIANNLCKNLYGVNFQAYL